VVIYGLGNLYADHSKNERNKKAKKCAILSNSEIVFEAVPGVIETTKIANTHNQNKNLAKGILATRDL